MYSPGMLYYVRIFNPVVLVKDLPPLSHSLPYPQAKLLTLSTRAPSLPAFLIVIGSTVVALLLVFFCAAQSPFFTDRLDSPCWGPRFGPGFFMIRVTAQTARRTSPRNFRLLRTDHARAPTGWADPRTALWNPHCGVTWNFGSFATN